MSHPLLTGMSAQDLDQLITALDTLRQTRRQAKQQHDQQRAHREGKTPHAPRSGRPPRLACTDRVLATILHLRLQLPHDTLALMFHSSRSTIHRAIGEIRQILDQHGTAIAPADPSMPLADLLHAAAQHINPTVKIKPASQLGSSLADSPPSRALRQRARDGVNAQRDGRPCDPRCAVASAPMRPGHWLASSSCDARQAR
jgi:hypothetical protein